MLIATTVFTNPLSGTMFQGDLYSNIMVMCEIVLLYSLYVSKAHTTKLINIKKRPRFFPISTSKGCLSSVVQVYYSSPRYIRTYHLV